MAARVKLSSPGMAALLKSNEVRVILLPHARAVLAAAKADPHDDTFEYENSLHIEHATTERAVVRVVADDWKAHILEARYGILARALGAAGS